MSDEEKRLRRRKCAMEKGGGKSVRGRTAEYHNKCRKEIAKLSGAHPRKSCSLLKVKFGTAQQYLFDRMRSLGKERDRWTQPNWQDLEAEVGLEAAEAMRDGLMAIWRRYKPTLASEAGACGNSTPGIETMALSGLEIEFRETPDWPTTLDDDEVQRVGRFIS